MQEGCLQPSVFYAKKDPDRTPGRTAMEKKLTKGSRIRLEIEDIVSDGRGVGHAAGGLTVFCAGGIPGDTVFAEVTRVKNRYVEASAVEIAHPSPDRVEPFCSVQGKCGGCPFGNIRYARQLELKQALVLSALTRIGGLKDPVVRPVLGMAEPVLHYRNKAVYHCAAGRRGEILVGFMETGSNIVTDGTACALQSEEAARAAEALRLMLEGGPARPYFGYRGAGSLLGMTVRTAAETGEVMIILTNAGNRIPGEEAFIESLADAVNELPEGILRGGDSRPAALFSVFREQRSVHAMKRPGKFVCIAGAETIEDRIGDLKIELSPDAFRQVNSPQTVVLYEEIFRAAELQGGETVLDLYCGAGSIGLYLSAKMNGNLHILGIEKNERAVRNANRNAVINGIVNARYLCGSAEEILPELVAESKRSAKGAGAGRRSGAGPEGDGMPEPGAGLTKIRLERADVAVLDPPRAGCGEALLSAVCDAQPRRIVYVSCEPPTLARDVRCLTGRGYRFEWAQPVDLFPHTGKAEVVTLLTRTQ